MAKAKKRKAEMRKLYTLTEVSKKTRISMPTLQRYKKLYQDRIPAEGSGRRQRYPKEALAVFKAIKRENIRRRGRPRKQQTQRPKPGRRAAKKRRAVGRKRAAVSKSQKSAQQQRGAGTSRAGELLSLLEISNKTGISYPTLRRYVELHLSEIPHVGKGRKRRYPQRAVPVFRSLRQQSRRGGKRGRDRARAGDARRAVATDRRLSERIRSLEKAQAEVSKQLQQIIRELKKPIRLTIEGG